MDNSTLRLKCKTLMAQNGYFERGAKKRLAKELNINRNSLCMALSGYRKGKASLNVLSKIVERFEDAQRA
ncbi:uncharacterized protein Dvar_36170 [Desulfosarcina variabilis str. Montpellier]|uniref:hypothetical protein n=1 Tax=Desulfosarcina variabilis TaxID=2300 RepID=UPI003AFB5BD9